MLSVVTSPGPTSSARARRMPSRITGEKVSEAGFEGFIRLFLSYTQVVFRFVCNAGFARITHKTANRLYLSLNGSMILAVLDWTIKMNYF
jgi:hypothetical protein